MSPKGSSDLIKKRTKRRFLSKNAELTEVNKNEEFKEYVAVTSEDGTTDNGSEDETKKPPRLIALRQKAILLYARGNKTKSAVANFLNIPVSTCRAWLRQAEQDGLLKNISSTDETSPDSRSVESDVIFLGDFSPISEEKANKAETFKVAKPSDDIDWYKVGVNNNYQDQDDDLLTKKSENGYEAKNSPEILFEPLSIMSKMQRKSKKISEQRVRPAQQHGLEFTGGYLINIPGAPLREPKFEDEYENGREPHGYYEDPVNKSLDWLRNQHHDDPIQLEEDHVVKSLETFADQYQNETCTSTAATISTTISVTTITAAMTTTMTANTTATPLADSLSSNSHYPKLSKNIIVTEQQRQLLHQQILQRALLMQQNHTPPEKLKPISKRNQRSALHDQSETQLPIQKQPDLQQSQPSQLQMQNLYDQQSEWQSTLLFPYATQSGQPYEVMQQLKQPQHTAQQPLSLQFPMIPGQFNPAALNPEMAQQIMHQQQMFMMSHFMQMQQQQQLPAKRQRAKSKKQKLDN